MPKRMPQAVKKAYSIAEVGCREQRVTTVTLKSSFLPEEPEIKISRGYCKGIGPRRPSFMCVLGPKPKPRTKDHPRRGEHHQRDPC